MKRTCVPAVLALLIAVALPATGSAAPILKLEPAFQSGNIGDIFNVALVIDNLGPTEEVDRIDVDISFNTSVLAPLAITPGIGLGTAADQVTLSSSFSGGVADFAQFSLLDELELQTRQGTSFLLATLTFQGIANGSSNFLITQATVLDFAQQSLSPSLENAAIRVGVAPPTTPVPEPGTLLLLGAGIAGLRWKRRQRTGAGVSQLS